MTKRSKTTGQPKAHTAPPKPRPRLNRKTLRRGLREGVKAGLFIEVGTDENGEMHYALPTKSQLKRAILLAAQAHGETPERIAQLAADLEDETVTPGRVTW